MTRIDVKEAEQRFDELLDRAFAGESFEITRDGVAIARMLAPRPGDPVVRDEPAP